ncbi:hypothetical protein DOTSEDRAFT_35357 [Dothistroma septosporum NZE10]|uniref:BTB domain-containing protein n=1 Tax=Dothistroma septosporum (strain NZE10 / CBS 128990) TaxID=675120 RepID=M2XKI5_DOTSN|nr:hypothetical protein DOTSEDRAFT_35357 [Dothistroma septosporum NZE10]
MSSPAGSSAKHRKLNFSDNVVVLAGAQKKSYTVHKDALVKHSKFFRAALWNGLKETRRYVAGAEDETKENADSGQVVRLPGIEPEMLEAYLQWSYSGQIVLTETAEDEKSNRGIDFQLDLARFYVVADVLDDALLRNSILDTMMASMKQAKRGPGPGIIREAYEHTSAASKLRQFVLEWHAFRIGAGARMGYVTWLERNIDHLPRNFVHEVLLRVARGREQRGPEVCPDAAERCRYHEHNDEVPACTV